MNNISTLLHDTMEEILKRLQVSFDKITVTEQDKRTYRINILTEDASILIGHFGDTLNALQYIIKSIISSQYSAEEEPIFIICDVEGYKERQEEKVKEMANKLVEKVKETRRPQHLSPMSPYFRKIVHMHLKQFESDGIASESEGEYGDRHIVIKMKEE